jgi:hypothetical protein
MGKQGMRTLKLKRKAAYLKRRKLREKEQIAALKKKSKKA